MMACGMGPASEEARDGASPGQVKARVRMAAQPTTAPEVLRALAQDPVPTVRAAVALNPVSDATTDSRLARDSDDRVRALLAGKLGQLLPELSDTEQSAAQAHVHGMLRLLADDAAVRVRTAMAEALMRVANAPRDIILKLAHDPAVSVSDPITRFSPLLTDADLLELLATPPHPAAAVAVASRAGLSEVVAAGIAEHADDKAVLALLSNRTASIQEATLDALIGRAGDHPEWHEPLACRPYLPLRSVRALSLIVAAHLLDVLASREDVPPELASELRSLVADRLDGPPVPSEAEVLDGVRTLNAAGQLDEAAFLGAAAAGNARRAAAILAVASGVPLRTIDRAAALRSPKALVSLVGRAGFTMRAGSTAQSLLGRVCPADVIEAAHDGSFPLSQSEMEWQIELLETPGQPGR